jgi:hypothetical protein
MPKYRLTQQEQEILLDALAVAADVSSIVNGTRVYGALLDIAQSVRVTRITVQYE